LPKFTKQNQQMFGEKYIHITKQQQNTFIYLLQKTLFIQTNILI